MRFVEKKRFNKINNLCVEMIMRTMPEFCLEHFGDRVKNWMTFNEPRVIATLCFDSGVNPPSRCSKEYGNCTEGNSGIEPYIAAHNMILAHATAVD